MPDITMYFSKKCNPRQNINLPLINERREIK